MYNAGGQSANHTISRPPAGQQAKQPPSDHTDHLAKPPAACRRSTVSTRYVTFA